MSKTDVEAFHVRKPTTIVGPSHAMRIYFGTVVFAYGNGYNRRSGRFTAPYDGIYYFFTQITANHSDNTSIWVNLVRDTTHFAGKVKIIQTRFFPYNDFGSKEIRGNLQALVYLKAGMEMYVEVLGNSWTRQNVVLNEHTHFSGCLLARM